MSGITCLMIGLAFMMAVAAWCVLRCDGGLDR